MTLAPSGISTWEEGDTQPQTKFNILAVSHNLWVSGRVLSRTTDAQPGSPAAGDAYIITGSASGAAWGGFTENYVAQYLDGAWLEYAPIGNVRVYVADEGVDVRWSGSAWVTPTASNEFADNLFRIQDNSDATKEIAFEASAITTGTTRTITMPDADVVLHKHNLAASAAPTVDNDIDEGYTVGSVWIDTTNDEIYHCLDNTDGAAVWKQVGSGSGGPLNKFDATADPTVDNDVDEGYSVGSRWINVTDDNYFVCVDATDGAAVWLSSSGLNQSQVDARVVAVTSGVRDLWVPVQQMIRPTNSPPATVSIIQGATNATKIAMPVALFDASTLESLHFIWMPPKNIDVSEGFSLTFYWIPTTTNTGNVYWRGSVEKVVDGATFDAFHSEGIGTDASMLDAAQGTANALHISPESTWHTGLTFAKGDILSFPFFRNASDAADTYTGDAGLVGVRIRYKVDAPTDD